MSRAEEIKHLLEKSRQMSVDETYPITEGEVIEFISSSFEFGFVCGALWQKQQDQARSAVEIAREEITEKACEYLDGFIELLNDHGHGLKKERIINGLKQAMKDETENL